MKQMDSIAFRINLLLAVLLLGTLPAKAVDWSFRAPHDAIPENAEEYEWVEESVELPAYPDREKMVEIKFHRPQSRFDFFIDLETLTVGDDGVVRYVVMLSSPSGSGNIMFEGIRCSNRDYKTFAYGTSENKFRRLSRPMWKEITQTSNNWFRHDLWEFYFCTIGEDLKGSTRESIINRINYPSAVRPRM